MYFTLIIVDTKYSNINDTLLCVKKWWMDGCVCAQSCPSLCDPMDCSPPGSSVHGISQARILEWAAMSFSKRFFLTWGSHPYLLHLLHCLALSHLGSQKIWYFPTFSWFSLGVYVNLNWYPVSQWGCHRISLDFTPCCAGSSLLSNGINMAWPTSLVISLGKQMRSQIWKCSNGVAWLRWPQHCYYSASGPRIWGVPVTL